MPSGVYRHGNRFRVIIDRKPVSFPTLAAARRAMNIRDGSGCGPISAALGTRVFRGMQIPEWAGEGELALIYTRSRNGALARKIPFFLKPRDVIALAFSSGGKCMVTGIPFSKKDNPQWRTNPWAASIDRVDSLAAYTLDNCRLVCVAANAAMNEWGVEVLERVARAVCGRGQAASSEKVEREAIPENIPNGNTEIHKGLISLETPNFQKSAS